MELGELSSTFMPPSALKCNHDPKI